MKIRIIILTLLFVFVFCSVSVLADTLLHTGYTFLDFLDLIDGFNCNLFKITSGYDNLYVACGRFYWDEDANRVDVSINRTSLNDGKITIGFEKNDVNYYIYDGYNVYRGNSGSVGVKSGSYDFEYSDLYDVELYKYDFVNGSFFLSGILKEGMTIAEMAATDQVVKTVAGTTKKMFQAGSGILSLVGLLMLLGVFWRRYQRRLI